MKRTQGLYINQAIALDRRKRKGIARMSWMPGGPMIIPTNTNGRLILMPKGTHEVRSGWMPNAADLEANDWFVYGY